MPVPAFNMRNSTRLDCLIAAPGIIAMMVVVFLQSGCATSVVMSGEEIGRSESKAPRSDVSNEEEWSAQENKVESTAVERRTRPTPRRSNHRMDEVNASAGWEGESVGWRDGVGDGRSFIVPVSLDYFQGFLVQVGVPSTSLPVDGHSLSPLEAMKLLPHLLATPVTMGNFSQRRMAAHLLLDVATGRVSVPRDELHERMLRFSVLRVLRPDGYLAIPNTGVAVQKVGEVVLADDGTLCANGFEVGRFYAIQGRHLFEVNDQLEVPRGAHPMGLYHPDDGVLLPVAEGAVLAVVDIVEGFYRLAFHTEETLAGLTQLPGVVRELYENAPQHWEAFRHKPHAERVRTISRLATGALLMVGSSGTGAAKAASWGGKLGDLSVPILSLAGDGLMTVRLVAIPVGRAVAVGSQMLSAAPVLYMANVGSQSGGGWTPPTGGPGRWEMADENMSSSARRYQSQVTGAPPGWVYRVWRNGEKVDFDGYTPGEGFLLDAKAFNYAKHFDENLDPKAYYQGAKKLIDIAWRQLRVANGTPIRWHVAETRMVPILQKMLAGQRIRGIEVVHTAPIPRVD